MNLHILHTPGKYRGYIRRRGDHKFRRVTGLCSTPEKALCRAVAKMDGAHHRAAVFFCPTGDSWYEPHMVMEAVRK